MRDFARTLFPDYYFTQQHLSFVDDAEDDTATMSDKYGSVTSEHVF